MRATGVILAGALAVAGWGADGSAEDARGPALQPLPLSGTGPTGQRYQLSRAPKFKGDDVPPSWCLRLRYDVGINIVKPNGAVDDLAGGVRTCGPRPQARVSGLLQADCKRRSAYVFGGATSTAGAVTLVTSRGKRIPAQQARAPRGSGYRGTVFVIAVALSDLPARLRSERGRVPDASFPARRKVCVPLPGAPEGGEPSGDFPRIRNGHG